jgi:hypothetical protein
MVGQHHVEGGSATGSGVRMAVRSVWAAQDERGVEWRSTRRASREGVLDGPNSVAGIVSGPTAKVENENVKGSTGRCRSWRERGGTAKTQGFTPMPPAEFLLTLLVFPILSFTVKGNRDQSV